MALYILATLCCLSRGGLFLFTPAKAVFLSEHLWEGEVPQEFHGVLRHPPTPDSIWGTIKTIISCKICLASEGDKWDCSVRGVCLLM